MKSAVLLTLALLVLPISQTGYATHSIALAANSHLAKTDSSARLSARVYDVINSANELTEQEDYWGALDTIGPLLDNPDELSSYERAQAYSFRGYLLFQLEEYVAATKSYQTVLDETGIPEGLRQQTQRTLAQLSFPRGRSVWVDRLDHNASCPTLLRSRHVPSDPQRPGLIKPNNNWRRHPAAQP